MVVFPSNILFKAGATTKGAPQKGGNAPAANNDDTTTKVAGKPKNPTPPTPPAADQGHENVHDTVVEHDTVVLSPVTKRDRPARNDAPAAPDQPPANPGAPTVGGRPGNKRDNPAPAVPEEKAAPGKTTKKERVSISSRLTLKDNAPAAGTPVAPTTTAVIKDPLIGTVMGGKWKIVRKLGEGGMGVVYAAEEIGTHKPVAIKLAKAGDNSADKWLRSEAKRLSQASGAQNVLQYIAAGEEGSMYYITTEYVQGETAAALLRGGDRVITVPDAIDILRSVCYGLGQGVHDKGNVHRDIKLENIMVAWNPTTGKPVAKLMDLGLAVPFMESGSTDGTVIGTPKFMSPEQMQGRALGPQSDIFSLGIAFHEMMTGELPFGIDRLGFPKFNSLSADAFNKMPSIIRDRILPRMLDLDPSKRYKNVGELMADIDSYIKTEENSYQTFKSSVTQGVEGTRTGKAGEPGSIAYFRSTDIDKGFEEAVRKAFPESEGFTVYRSDRQGMEGIFVSGKGNEAGMQKKVQAFLDYGTGKTFDGNTVVKKIEVGGKEPAEKLFETNLKDTVKAGAGAEKAHERLVRGKSGGGFEFFPTQALPAQNAPADQAELTKKADKYIKNSFDRTKVFGAAQEKRIKEGLKKIGLLPEAIDARVAVLRNSRLEYIFGKEPLAKMKAAGLNIMNAPDAESLIKDIGSYRDGRKGAAEKLTGYGMQDTNGEIRSSLKTAYEGYQGQKLSAMERTIEDSITNKVPLDGKKAEDYKKFLERAKTDPAWKVSRDRITSLETKIEGVKVAPSTELPSFVKDLALKLGVKPEVLAKLEKSGELEKVAEEVGKKLDMKKVESLLTGPKGLEMLADPEKGPALRKLIEDAQKINADIRAGRDILKSRITGLAVGLATLFGAEGLADAFGITDPAERFVFVLGLSHTANYTTITLFKNGGVQQAYRTFVESVGKMAGRGTPLLERLMIPGRPLLGFSVNLIKGLGAMSVVGNILKNVGIEGTANTVLTFAGTSGAEMGYEYLLKQLTTKAAAVGEDGLISLGTQVAGKAAGALRFAGATVAWATTISFLGDSLISYLDGPYDTSVKDRVIDRLKKEGMYSPGVTGWVGSVFMPAAHKNSIVDNAENLAFNGRPVSQGYVDRQRWAVTGEDSTLSFRIRGNVAEMLAPMAGAANGETAIAETLAPINWGTLTVGTKTVMRRFAHDVMPVSVPNNVSEKSICEYALQVIQANPGKSADDPIVADAVMKKFGLTSASQYTDLIPKMMRMVVQNQIATLYFLDPGGYGKLEVDLSRSNDLNADIRRMFNKDGTLKSGQAGNFTSWIKREKSK